MEVCCTETVIRPPEIKCLTCGAVFSVIYNRHLGIDGWAHYCPVCGEDELKFEEHGEWCDCF